MYTGKMIPVNEIRFSSSDEKTQTYMDLCTSL